MSIRKGCRAFHASREWPTWALLIACQGGWVAVLTYREALGVAWAIAAVLLVTLHSSLQHECLHGHPTRSRRLNELLVFPAPGLFVPYRRFRDLHVRHHVDERLTDPFDDPESWYLGADDWARAGPVTRALLSANRTLCGRLAVGPALALAGFWRGEWRAARADAAGVRKAWCLHALATVPVAATLAFAGLHPLTYALAVAYPAMSVLMIRTFVEHRAAALVGERTAVVEAGPILALLFLNNNLHAVHHAAPATPWYALPAAWRAARATVLERNGGYHFPGGYAEVARRWLLVPREPVVHPLAPGHDRAPAGCGPMALPDPAPTRPAPTRPVPISPMPTTVPTG